MVVLYALALLCVDNEVLLVRRLHEQFGNGQYSLVGGKVEHAERALQAVRREVLEETGLDLPESAFTPVHTMHRLGTESPFMVLCFKANITGMAPKNVEPEKHDDMRMFALNQLPENILPAHKQMLACVEQGISYSEHGWDAERLKNVMNGQDKSGIMRRYFDALQAGSYDAVMELFEKDALVYSPLYGRMQADRFYKELLAKTKSSKITLKDVFQNPENRSHAAAHFLYDWTLSDGTPAPFECIDLFEFSERNLIKSLKIIYDTQHVRQKFEGVR